MTRPLLLAFDFRVAEELARFRVEGVEATFGGFEGASRFGGEEDFFKAGGQQTDTDVTEAVLLGAAVSTLPHGRGAVAHCVEPSGVPTKPVVRRQPRALMRKATPALEFSTARALSEIPPWPWQKSAICLALV